MSCKPIYFFHSRVLVYGNVHYISMYRIVAVKINQRCIQIKRIVAIL